MLPKIQYPIYDMVIPSTEKRVKFRPMTVKEEKILLISKEGEDQTHIFNSIIQVINNCMLDKIDIRTLPIFDIEFMFIRLRAVSINDVTKLSFVDKEDNETRDFDVKLNDIVIKQPDKKPDKVVKINKDLSIELRYPVASVLQEVKASEVETPEFYNRLIRNVITTISEKDKKHDFQTASPAEQDEFVDGLDTKSYNKIREWIDNTPKVYYKIEYENKMKNKRTIVLDNLFDFFRLA